MKIKTTDLDYNKVISLPRPKHFLPKKPSAAMRALVKSVSMPELKKAEFTYDNSGLEALGKNTPALVLMNHSSFIDLKIASAMLWPRPYNIVCTSDGFVGKEKLMRSIGCIPAKKFITDTTLVRDMRYALDRLKCSVLMYPEASYSFDGTATPLPGSIGKLLKLLNVPVIMIRTYGAFLRDPLYNSLQIRNVSVSAESKYILSPEDIAEKSADELNGILKKHFTFDNFSWQKEHSVVVDEPFRADGLGRVLYKCPSCNEEGCLVGKGTALECKKCGKKYELTELGEMKTVSGETKFSHIPDWYAWERKCVRDEIENGSYCLDIPVKIRMMVDMKSIYTVGSGRLVHNTDGFHLTGCDGRLNYTQKPAASYSLYSDYYWYELGDMICIGDSNALYYCFPETEKDVVAKTRLAAEELYKLKTSKKKDSD